MATNQGVHREALTQRRVERLTPADGQVIWDAALPGFGVAISRGGAKSYVVQYRHAGQSRRYTIGSCVAWKLEAARQEAKAKQVEISKGVDPLAERAAAREAVKVERQRSSENTVAALVEQFVAEITAPVEAEGEQASGGRRRKRRRRTLKTADEVARQLRVLLVGNERTKSGIPILGDRAIAEITRRDLVKLHDAIIDRCGGVAANRALAWTKRFFAWAVSKDHIDANPARDVEKQGAEHKGDRVLDDAEIRDVWGAADALGYPHGAFVQMLLLTGRRRSSVAAMRRSEIKGGLWKPAGGSANKGAPELPLTSTIEALIAELPTGGDHLFRAKSQRRHGSRVVETTPDAPIADPSGSKEKLDTVIAAAREAEGRDPMPAWTLHDLRRTVETRMAELRVPGEVRDLVMGHVRAGMAKVYDHSERREDKRDALARWHDGLARILRGEPFLPTATIVRLPMAG